MNHRGEDLLAGTSLAENEDIDHRRCDPGDRAPKPCHGGVGRHHRVTFEDVRSVFDEEHLRDLRRWSLFGLKILYLNEF